VVVILKEWTLTVCVLSKIHGRAGSHRQSNELGLKNTVFDS